RNRAESQQACRKALKAAEIATWRMADFNRRRRAANDEEIGFGLGLHVGNVMFGNVGLKDRLTFSAFGAAVNEVERLQSLTKKYSTEVVASQAFSSYTDCEWGKLGEEKLRGVRQRFTVVYPKMASAANGALELFPDTAADSLSEAEQVILLHRDAKKFEGRVQVENLTPRPLSTPGSA
ncbi:MAG: adenylate/guanylate cyclase domain-containing protein, partial [Rhizobium sp.]